MNKHISTRFLPLLSCKTCSAECQNIYNPDRTLEWIGLHSRAPHVLDNTPLEIDKIKELVLEQIAVRDKRIKDNAT